LPTSSFFVLAEDLGKSLSGLHKARCRMSEITDFLNGVHWHFRLEVRQEN